MWYFISIALIGSIALVVDELILKRKYDYGLGWFNRVWVLVHIVIAYFVFLG